MSRAAMPLHGFRQLLALSVIGACTCGWIRPSEASPLLAIGEGESQSWQDLLSSGRIAPLSQLSSLAYSCFAQQASINGFYGGALFAPMQLSLQPFSVIAGIDPTNYTASNLLLPRQPADEDAAIKSIQSLGSSETMYYQDTDVGLFGSWNVQAFGFPVLFVTGIEYVYDTDPDLTGLVIGLGQLDHAATFSVAAELIQPSETPCARAT